MNAVSNGARVSIVRMVEAVVIAAVAGGLSVYATQQVIQTQLTALAGDVREARNGVNEVDAKLDTLTIKTVAQEGVANETRLRIEHIADRQQMAIQVFEAQLEDYRQVDIRQWQVMQSTEERVDELEGHRHE